MDVIQSIQSILAPAIMISSCGLLLLGLNNKYSNVISRIRLLNNERRKLFVLASNKEDLEYQENIRLNSLHKQINQLLVRCRLVRNSIISIVSAVCLFVLTSLLLAAGYFSNMNIFQSLALIVFIIGMCCVFVGIFTSGKEVLMAYKIAIIEVKAEE